MKRQPFEVSTRMYRWSTTTAILFLTLANLPLLPFQPVQEAVKGNSLPVNRLSFDQPLWLAIVQKNQTTISDQQQPKPSQQDKNAEGKQKTTSPQQREKKVPVKDFVPSEKIKADKAVDFPADI
jgi:hypothetical protein